MLGFLSDTQPSNLNGRIAAQTFFIYESVLTKTVKFCLIFKIRYRDFVIRQAEISKHFIGLLIFNDVGNRQQCISIKIRFVQKKIIQIFIVTIKCGNRVSNI